MNDKYIDRVDINVQWLRDLIKDTAKENNLTPTEYINNIIISSFDEDDIIYYQSGEYAIGREKTVTFDRFGNVSHERVEQKRTRKKKKPTVRPYHYKTREEVREDLKETKAKLKKEKEKNESLKMQLEHETDMKYTALAANRELKEINRGLNKKLDMLENA